MKFIHQHRTKILKIILHTRMYKYGRSVANLSIIPKITSVLRTFTTLKKKKLFCIVNEKEKQIL